VAQDVGLLLQVLLALDLAARIALVEKLQRGRAVLDPRRRSMATPPQALRTTHATATTASTRSSSQTMPPRIIIQPIEPQPSTPPIIPYGP